MSAINDTKIRFSSLSGRVVLARFGKSETEALEVRDATSEFLQTFVSYAFDGRMPEKSAAVEVKFGGGDEQFIVRVEREGERIPPERTPEDQAPVLLAQLKRLENTASRIARYGATPGPQWVELTKALLSARRVLDSIGEKTDD